MLQRFLLALIILSITAGCSAQTANQPNTPTKDTIPSATIEATTAQEIHSTPSPVSEQVIQPTTTIGGSTPSPTLLITLAAAPATAEPLPTMNPEKPAIIVDHTSVSLFDQIPEEYLAAAANLKMMYADRSVGSNINTSLDCLASPSWSQSPAHCRIGYIGSSWDFKMFTQAERSSGSVPPGIIFDPSPVKYNRSNWVFEMHSGEWSSLTQDFVERLVPQYIQSTDVLSYQITYLNVEETSDITDPAKGFFADNTNKYDIYDLEKLMAANPDKVFILWTTSLARSIGTQVATDFNDQMRRYAIENGKILFDVADILSHTVDGTPCYDNRDGVKYCSQNGKCEEFPDDKFNLPAICQDYTTETNGGHLGSVSAGGIQVAKAFWVLMARIAGWNGLP